jgi:DNA (cytosine-5)-methyltransferase 1
VGELQTFETHSIPSEPLADHKFTFVDLFAGNGGLHHGLSSLGGECVLSCEFDPAAQKVWRAASV